MFESLDPFTDGRVKSEKINKFVKNTVDERWMKVKQICGLNNTCDTDTLHNSFVKYRSSCTHVVDFSHVAQKGSSNHVTCNVERQQMAFLCPRDLLKCQTALKRQI